MELLQNNDKNLRSEQYQRCTQEFSPHPFTLWASYSFLQHHKAAASYSKREHYRETENFLCTEMFGEVSDAISTSLGNVQMDQGSLTGSKHFSRIDNQSFFQLKIKVNK